MEITWHSGAQALGSCIRFWLGELALTEGNLPAECDIDGDTGMRSDGQRIYKGEE